MATGRVDWDEKNPDTAMVVKSVSEGGKVIKITRDILESLIGKAEQVHAGFSIKLNESTPNVLGFFLLDETG